MAEKDFDTNSLTDEQKKDFQFVKNRITELQEARKFEFNGEVEKVWSEADRDYVPHRLKTKGRRAIATDEDKGWRSSLVALGSAQNWQSDISQPNVFTKIQVALSILVDRNPSGVFTGASKKYEAVNKLIEQLYQRSWEVADSKSQLSLFIFNLAKYGWACARTYPLRITRKVKTIVEYNDEDASKTKYKEKEVVEYNDIMRENLDPWNVWIDDMAKPNNRFSIRDWAWRKVYPKDVFMEEFGRYKNAKLVKPGGIITERVDSSVQKEVTKRYTDRDLIEVYFYENRIKDLFGMVANGVPVILEPLPIADAKGLKRLSIWQTYWALRNSNSTYGIGIYESIRYDQALIDKVRNMTIDQLVLSIYKMFFYRGTDKLTETGDIKITPGVGKSTLDPKGISWLDVPGPGKEAWMGLENFKKDLDEASGITDPLEGTITGKTAFEIAQAKESALRRLKTPLNNVLDALNEEAYITVALIQLLYSIPETYSIADPDLIDQYLNETQSDQDLYERDEQGNFTAKVFREFPINLDEDEKGNLIETPETKFFRIKPRFLQWDGVIRVKSQSILTPSKQIDKALELEMYNMLIPLLANPPEIYNKVAKSILKLYEKDPKDVLPDSWLQETPQGGLLGGEPLVVPQGQPGGLPQGGQPQDAERLLERQHIPERPESLTQRIVGKMSAPFRRV